MTGTQSNPLVDKTPPEIPLKRSPLVRVIAQVKFPLILSIERQDFIAPFQESLRSAYPVLRQEQAQNMILSFEGTPVHAQPKTLWRFQNTENHWQISLSQDFISLDTTQYTSRDDFISRLQQALELFGLHVGTTTYDRFGIRYVDHFPIADINDIRAFIRDEAQGVFSNAAASQIAHSITETLFSDARNNAEVVTRYGLLPAKATIDPNVFLPSEKTSFVLDIDMFRTTPSKFVVASMTGDARLFAERIYTMFRWFVTKEFLKNFGGDV